MAKDKVQYDTLYRLLPMWPRGFADLFVERDGGATDRAVLSLVPRDGTRRVDVMLGTDELEGVARWLLDYCERMRGAEAGGTLCRV